MFMGSKEANLPRTVTVQFISLQNLCSAEVAQKQLCKYLTKTPIFETDVNFVPSN